MSWDRSSHLLASEYPHLMLYANLLTLRASRLKTSKRGKASLHCLKCFDPIRWVFSLQSKTVNECVEFYENSQLVQKWRFLNCDFQNEGGMGRKWMVLIRHWHLFVYDRWRIKNGGGRQHLGGRPGFFIFCWSATVVGGSEEDNRWQTKEKPIGSVKRE